MGVDRDRLARILGMLGSSHDGEILAAARAAEQMRNAAKLTWGQILEETDSDKLDVAIAACQRLLDENETLKARIVALEAGTKALPAPQPWSQRTDSRSAVLALMLWPQFLTEWEQEFLESLTKRRQHYTVKQFTRLQQIGEKIDAMLAAQWRYQRAVI